MKLNAVLWSKAAFLAAMTAFGFGAGHSVGHWSQPDCLILSSERGHLSLGTRTVEGYEEEEGELVELFGLLIQSNSRDGIIGLFLDEDSLSQVMCGHVDDRALTIDTSSGIELDLRTMHGTSATMLVNDLGESVAELRSPGTVTQIRSTFQGLIHVELEKDE